MQHIQFFDNTDDMFDAISRGVESAKARATEKQNAITYGDYWMRMWEGFLIFGYIQTREELDAEERRLGASEEELESEHEAMDYSYSNGFRFGRAYSIIESEGELGDTHVSDMIPITKEEFEQAKECFWSLEAVQQLPWFNKTLLDRV